MLKTIHLDEAQIDELLERLDAEGGSSKSGTKGAKMFPYRIKRLCVTMEQPGGMSAQFQVVARALSETDIAFLHGGFVHAGTSCTVQLISSYGTWDNVTGTVTSCRYLHGSIHEIITRFHERVDVPLYVRAAVQTRVLLVEDEPISTNIATYHLRQLNATVDHVEDGQEAVDKALVGNYDLVLMDIELPGMNGLDATKELRAKGYMGMIVAVTALTEKDIEEKCLACGCDRYIPKPYDSTDLADLLATMVEEPLYSTLADREEMVPIINSFVEELPARIRALEEALVARDLETVKTFTRRLKGEGGACGFEPITSIAAEVEGQLMSGAEVDAIRTKLVELTKLCRSAKPANDPLARAGDAESDD